MAAAAGALAAAAATALVYFGAVRPDPMEVARVAEATVRPEIHAPGTVQARVPVAISSRVTGVVSRVVVDVGERVRKGQLLVVLDDKDLRAKEESSRASVTAATESVAAAEAAVDKAIADLDLARLNHGRSSNLVKQGFIAPAEHDASTAALRVAEASEASARRQVGARRADLARVEHELRVAQAELSYAQLDAPMDGVVTRRLLEAGSVVVPSTQMLQLVDPASLWVATLVDESLVGRVREGQPAALRLRSGPRLTGKVVRVTFQSDPITRELEVDVAFDASGTRFSINEEVEVTIIGEPDTGLVVPAAAVARRASVEGVFVVRAGRAAFKPVQLGVIDGRNVRVHAGVEAGDLVVASANGVKQGQRVRPVER